ncbi:MAG: tetratricopeptide repeat protein [Paludibacteraceae bacterium]|nr:tetratricopeptide repeat protein [Paludibacteraceae bacterium]
MKKTLLMAALVLISMGCVAQKSNVNKAKSLILSEDADFDQARELIGAALTNEETKDQANTWFVAGLIGYQQNDQAIKMQYLGQAIDQDKVGQGIMESYDYWIKADEIAMTPVLNKKGVEVVDTKTRNNIAKKMFDYYKNQDFIKYGVYLNEQRNFKGAYNVFMRHLKMRDLPMMQDEKMLLQMPKDTIYEQYEYYAALFAIQAQMHPEAIAALEDIKAGSYEAIAVNQFLYQEYLEVKDTASSVRVLQDAMIRFPQEPWFLQNLINHYIFSKQEDKAIEYLNQAIEREPKVAEYHLIKGNLDANQGNNESALADYDRAIELNPQLADAYAGKGRIHYNIAGKMIEDAAYIQDAKAYKAALNAASDKLKESLPFFEKALEVAPENREYMVILKGIYYRLHMDKEYEAMQDKLNN